MPGREEALERVRGSRRLGELRQQLNTERTDNTLLRDWSNSIPQPLPPHLRGDEEAKEGSEAASSALAGFVALTGATATAGLGTAKRSDDELKESGIYKGSLKQQYQELLPNISPVFYESSENSDEVGLRSSGVFRGGGSNYKDEKLYQKLPKTDNWFSEVHGLSEGEMFQAELEASAHSAGRDPRKPSKEDYEYARQSVQKMADELPVPGVDWDRAPGSLGQRTYPYLVSAKKVPTYGPDLGGFSRNRLSTGDAETTTAYTVVPNSNAGRFRSRLLPSLIDRVYGEAINYRGDDSNEWGAYTAELALNEPRRPVAKRRWGSLSADEKIGMLLQEAPGRPGTYPAGYVWGTLYDRPRYEYASIGGQNAPNPEIVVSDVRTPPELETSYMPTRETFDPRVVYKRSPSESAVGPAWGVSDYLGAPGPGRPRRNTTGDMVWRNDLTERRGALSLADAQAVQQQLGIPVSVRRSGELSEQVLERAVEGIRQAEKLESHADVVNRYARNLPRQGSTTAPRQPAQAKYSSFEMDTKVAVPSGVRERFDLHRGMQEAGFSPTRPGVQQLNKAAQEAAKSRVGAFNAVRGTAPLTGVGLSLADPGAAAVLGAAVRERDPEVRAGLTRDAVRIYGENAVIGGLSGGAISGALTGAARMGLPGLASGAASVLGVTAPALAVQAVSDSADQYLKGATGRGLAAHFQDFRDKSAGMSDSMMAGDRRPEVTEGWITVAGKGRRWRDAQGNYYLQRPGDTAPSEAQQRSGGGAGRQVAPQLFPQPRAVMANTASGVAQVVPTRRNNPVAQEAVNRVNLAKQRFNPARGDFGVSELLFGR